MAASSSGRRSTGDSAAHAGLFRPLLGPADSNPARSGSGTARMISTVLLGAPPFTSSTKSSNKRRNPSRQRAASTDRTLPSKPNGREIKDDFERRIFDDAAARPSLRRQNAVPSHRVARDSDDTELEEPPSPSLLPGGYTWSVGRSQEQNGKQSEQYHAALRLPPPLLDDASTPESFEGLLGIRRDRETQRSLARQQRLQARDRPPPKNFSESLLGAASKLYYTLAPPTLPPARPVARRAPSSHFVASPTALDDDIPLLDEEEQEASNRNLVKMDRRRERSELSLKGYEATGKLATRVATRLRREASSRRSKAVAESKGLHLSLDRADSLVVSESTRTDQRTLPPRTLTPSALFAPHTRSQSETKPTDVESEMPLSVPRAPRLVALESDILPSPFPFEPSIPAPNKLQRPAQENDYFATSHKQTHQSHLSLLHALRSMIEYIRSKSDALTWLLIGDFQEGAQVEEVGGLIGAIYLLAGFVYFVLVHLVALLYSTAQVLRTASLFVYWIFVNLTGKTDLSRVVMRYYRSCRAEWDSVASQDHETLSLWAVILGLAEMAAVHAVTRDRYLLEGPGQLERLSPASLSGPSNATAHSSPRMSRRQKRKSVSAEGEQLIVTKDENNILEGTLFSPRADTTQEERFAYLGGILQSPALEPMKPRKSLDAKQDSDDFMRRLKRHCRFSTASYGLHSYILHPPTPLFTPSGATLPHTIFSSLSKISDKASVLHVAIQKEYSGAWGADEGSDTESEWEPSFYLIRDHDNREIIVTFRGTQSLHDIVTDLTADDETLMLDNLEGDGQTSYRIHSGILKAARRLIDADRSPLYATLKTALQDNPDYALALTGHSLGGAVASAVAILLAQYEPSAQDAGSGRWRLSAKCDLPGPRDVYAYCYAHPTTLDAALCDYCAAGTQPLVYSVCLAADIIPRIGPSQMRETRRILGRLARLRRGVMPKTKHALFETEESQQHASWSILRLWWRWRRLGGGVVLAEGQELPEEAAQLAEHAWSIRNGLDMALDDSTTRDEPAMMRPPGKVYHVDRLPVAEEARARLEARSTASPNDEEEEERWTIYRVTKPSSFFAYPWLELDAVRAHLPQVYLDSIEAL
ncbi:hypothetical protein E5Q_01444 [Mixia osmundae IAM 14324]|uniref:sn-1-specific diacylglycerol lipase n=1 Tax=Mixia osmundae (strain CBS 9802 / IAM 14324 / JCM 22182 / KY 12970) TaxID=764103 RepID=G7DWA2_MIXOS|nr:hypothetical protein E5Q_01444 [Mixia osmundae IAM 14324]